MTEVKAEAGQDVKTSEAAVEGGQLKFAPSQVTLTDEGEIFYQEDKSNPLPGVCVGRLQKGEALLVPGIVLDAADVDMEASIRAYLRDVLSVLYGLLDPVEVEYEPVRCIQGALYEHAGMMARASVEASIKALDSPMRAALRAKGVRLGPLYVYCPEMNKPVALRLRALLWGVYHGIDLPVTRVRDGMVSARVEGEGLPPLSQVQKDVYTALCYPVYAGRVVRVDMLERVVNAVYEHAKNGKFEAQHAMAEWVGCSTLDLYAVLEALGHKKVHDPAEERARLEAEAEVDAVAASCERGTDGSDADEGAGSDASGGAVRECDDVPEAERQAVQDEGAPKGGVKPSLATFALKRGPANGGVKRRRPAKGGSRGETISQGQKGRRGENAAGHAVKNKAKKGGGKQLSSQAPLQHSPFAAALSALKQE